MITEPKKCPICVYAPYIGIAFLLLMLTILGYLLTVNYLRREEQSGVPAYNPEAGLGEIGALCGGELRLPCKPGNACLITNQELQEGVCALVNENPGPMQPPAYTPDIPEN